MHILMRTFHYLVNRELKQKQEKQIYSRYILHTIIIPLVSLAAIKLQTRTEGQNEFRLSVNLPVYETHKPKIFLEDL